jgi:UDP-glucose:(heptosyl)LPS alpha-1,3-glucosyltransferase
MRVALTYPDVTRAGGIERVVLECANYLVSRGHEARLLASRVEPGALDERVRVEHIQSPRKPDFMAMLRYRRRATDALAAAAGATDVHASFGSQSPRGGVLWVPSVHQAAMDMILSRRGFPGRLKQRVNPDHLTRLRLERDYYAGRTYAALIACTEQVRNELARYHAVPEQDVAVQPLGFDNSEFDVSRRNELRPGARAELGLGPGDRVVVFVANELERKGFDTLLRAIARLREPDLHLLVVGRVSPAGYAGELDRLGLGPRVRFVGPSSDIGYFHAAADAFALPTRYEPWGLVIIEALASGLPVVTTRLAGAAAAVEEGRAGWLLDDPDDVEGTAVGLDWALRGGAASPEAISASVNGLAWPRVLERYESILLDVASR